MGFETKEEGGATPAKPVVEEGIQQDVNVASIGFGTRDMFMMNNNQGSEYTNGLALALTEIYKTVPGANKPKVTVLDKETISGLAYSNIIISMIGEGKDVNYFIIALEGTGRKPMKAVDIISEVTNTMRQPNMRPNIFTTDDGIDTVLHDTVVDMLTTVYGSKDFISVDGLVIGHSHPDINTLVPNLAAIGYNACTIDSGLSSGKVSDLNITDAKNASRTSILKFETNMLKQTVTNEIGSPVRSDFTVDLNVVDTNNQLQSINLQNAKTTLTSITGFVDAIPEETVIPGAMGGTQATGIRLHPHVIINSNSVYTPTPGYMLLGLVSSLVMTNSNMWLGAVKPKGKKELHNTGALNIYTNLGNNQNRIGDVLDLNKVSGDESFGMLKQMYSLSPIISMDIESFGPQSFYQSVLALAATPGESRAKYAAVKEIIMSAHHLTNGKFPSDFNPDLIFANSGVTVPLGMFHDKTGERDIREIDLAFIATQSGDVQMMNDWTASNVPNGSGKDPYLTKVDIISKLIPDAEITGKAIRVTFSSDFITVLSQAASAAGLDATYQPEVVFLENTTIASMGSHLQYAGINTNVSGFARQNVAQAGFGASQNFAQMGNRFYR